MSTNETIREDIEVAKCDANDIENTYLARSDALDRVIAFASRAIEALERIVEGAPTESPKWGRYNREEAPYQSDRQHYRLAEIARAALSTSKGEGNSQEVK